MTAMQGRLVSALCSALLMASTSVHAAGPPLQASVLLDMPAAEGESRRVSSKLEGGDARVVVVATNQDDTVRVQLRFRYTIDPDTIAFDEILSRLVVEAIDEGGASLSKAVVVPNEMNLNPNRVPLFYEVTLYRPDVGYRIRTRVFGNYE